MIEHHYEDINGLRTHFVTAGAGAPILFLHGFPEFWGVWARQLDAFAPSHLVIAPDNRGANETQRPVPVEKYGIDYLVADVRALLDHLDLDRATIVAQDWGALIGWSFVLRHPDRVSRFVTINVSHPALLDRALREDPAQQQASQYMLDLRAPGGEDRILADDGAALDRSLFDDARARGAEISADEQARWRSIMLGRGHLTAGLNLYRAAELGPPSGDAKGGSNLVEGLTADQLEVRVPVLVLSGTADPQVLPSTFAGLEDYVEDLTIERLEGAGHWVALERPTAVNEAIRRFLGR